MEQFFSYIFGNTKYLSFFFFYADNDWASSTGSTLRDDLTINLVSLFNFVLHKP